MDQKPETLRELGNTLAFMRQPNPPGNWKEAVDMLHEKKDNIFVGPAIAWEVSYLEKCESIGVTKETVIAQGYQKEIDATIETVAKLREADIKLVVGGDYGISIAPHGTYAKDLEYFVYKPIKSLVDFIRQKKNNLNLFSEKHQ